MLRTQAPALVRHDKLWVGAKGARFLDVLLPFLQKGDKRLEIGVLRGVFRIPTTVASGFCSARSLSVLHPSDTVFLV
jgi:hypothetical protein